ncbi:MAG: Ig-like domain-containing protein [Desulfurivibrionaceae bacterium]
MSDIIHSRRLPKKIIFFLLTAILGLAASAGAAHNVTISWDQPSSGEPVLAYQLYQDDQLICETSDPAARSITCSTELGGKGFFRVAAVYDDTDGEVGEVEPVNNPPVAQDLAVTLNENDTATSFLSATDPDNDPLNYVIVTPPASGAAVLIDSVSGEFQYTPKKDFSGSDSFTYQASDGSANSATATVSLTVMPVNNPPVAQDLTVTLDANNTATSFLSATDPDNDPLNYAIVTPPTSGAAVLIDSVSGEFQYTPKKDFSGSDSFTFQASDGSANSATATVSLAVMPPVNDPPVANAGPDQVVNEGETVTLDATKSADPDDGIASYSWTQLSGPSAPLSASGAVQPTFTAPDVEGEGEVLTYQLTVTDQAGLQDQDTVDISVVNKTADNQVPIASGLEVSVEEDGLLHGQLVGSDADGDPLTYTIQSAPAKGSVEMLDAATGEFSYTPRPDFNGTDSFLYSVTDGEDISGDAEVTVTVLPVNDPPVANAGPDQIVNVGEMVSLDGTNSFDIDDDLLTFFWIQLDGPAVNLSDPTAMQPSFEAIDNGADSTTLTFQLMVTDGEGLEATDVSSVNVVWVNEPPVAAAGEDQTVLEGETVTLDASGSSDSDDGISTFSWVQLSGPEMALSDSTAAQPSFTAPDVDTAGASMVFEVTVTDFGGLYAKDEVIVNVSWVNTPPVADAGVDQSVSAGEIVALDGSLSYDEDDGIAKVHWTQKSGVPVTLSDPTALQPEFDAPADIVETEPLNFELAITDFGGLQHTDSCLVEVIPQQQQALVGDLNGDGVLDKNDKQLLKKSLNSCVGDQNYLESADLDGDGCVTKNDDDLWQQL